VAAAADIDPGGALGRLAERAGIAFPALTAARARTASRLVERRAALAPLAPPGDDAAVVLVGSWGRAEVTAASDDDWLVLAAGPPGDPGGVRPAPGEVAASLEERAPGREGIFGTVCFAGELVGNIGLARDSNANLTRRMLLTLESVPVLGDRTWAAARDDIVASYLGPRARDYRPPRFFLNDVVRYWRTVAVDFEGKDREREGAGWGLRSAKLRTSRKILFASGLLPLLECHRLAARDMPAFLGRELAVPATDRVAAAFERYDAIDTGARALAAYDRFVALLDDPTARARLSALTEDDAPRSPELAEARALADQVQGGLLSLLFDDLRLAPVTREYGIF
jgi:hypothetical protein